MFSIRKDVEFNFHKIGLGYEHYCRSILLGHQHIPVKTLLFIVTFYPARKFNIINGNPLENHSCFSPFSTITNVEVALCVPCSYGETASTLTVNKIALFTCTIISNFTSIDLFLAEALRAFTRLRHL